MTAEDAVRGPEIRVAGVDSHGAEQVSVRLGHGDDPELLLGRLGFATTGPDAVVGESDPHRLTLVYRVRRGSGPPVQQPMATPRDPALVIRADEEPVPIQRVAVYALVHSVRGILLSQNSARTNAEGTWSLCGGGVDPGELPEDALHREVWEETGQVVQISALAAISTRHWVGRAPHGRLEDFHAVRLIYRATCSQPTHPVVHDVGGTTSAAAWVPVAQVADLSMPSGWRDLVLALVHSTA